MIKYMKNLLTTWGMAIILITSVLLAVTMGTVSLSVKEAYGTIVYGVSGIDSLKNYGECVAYDIVWSLRLPRIILAVMVGMGLSVCGVVMQSIVKNPLADPFILGVSSGASFGATVAILLGVGAVLGENFIGLVAAGGAFAVSIGVLILSNCGGRSNSMKLLLSGMALSAICSAFSSFIVYFANNKEGIQTITYWLMGSLANAKWDNLFVMCPVIVIGTLFFYSQSRVLNLMLLGDDTAITLGTDLNRFRHLYLMVTALMVGFVVYNAGMIGFVGLIIPHVIRMFVGTDHKKLIPGSALVGGIFLIWADVMCRIIIPRTELPIGILISLIGAPCFVYLMVKRTYGFGGNE
ncbi:FecCD family ABC transporter permease [Anaerovibrio sp.]|uniref:FecCD family ABC transporter permease n=1 Tax=Anaerovibrio sp. TaxID=1872532 RepID=UPI00388FE19F